MVDRQDPIPSLTKQCEPKRLTMLRKWIQWLVPQMFFCLNLAGVVVYAVTSSSLGSALKLSSAQVAGLGGAYFIAYALSQLLLGSSLGALPARYLLGITALNVLSRSVAEPPTGRPAEVPRHR